MSLRSLLRTPAYRLRRKVANIQNYPALRRNPLRAAKHLLLDPELDNFTYDISNNAEMSIFIARILGQEENKILGYTEELLDNKELSTTLAQRQGRAAHFGRRVGWYAVVRALKPKTIIEAGVHDGLGATAILAALQKNAGEGHIGMLIGMDIRPEPETCWLIPSHLRQWFEFIPGDIAETLPPLLEKKSIDLFIHDSDHSEEFERMEYKMLEPFLLPHTLVMSDSAGPKGDEPLCVLEVWSQQTQRQFNSWQEKPMNHFYYGAWTGISKA